MSHTTNKEFTLESSKYDFVASAAKSVLGTVPFAGSLLSEFAGHIIPNQRLERLTKFAKILEDRFQNLEQNFIYSQLTNENFSALFEESMHQASKSVSDARRQYLANLITSSLSQQDLEYAEAKHLLRILSELNDTEVLWLRLYAFKFSGDSKSFREAHAEIFKRPPAFAGSPQEAHDKLALQDNYKSHLAELNLLMPQYSVDNASGLPEFDRVSGSMKLSGYEITQLGSLVLRNIGIHPDKN